MSTIAAIAFGVVGTAWAVAAWDLGRKWIQERSAAALILKFKTFVEEVNRESSETRGMCVVNRKAIENLAKEMDDKVATITAQQVGVLSGMAQHQRQRAFK